MFKLKNKTTGVEVKAKLSKDGAFLVTKDSEIPVIVLADGSLTTKVYTVTEDAKED